MTKQEKIETLTEYRELQELKATADKRLKEIKREIEQNISAGKYGNMLIHFELREVKEYVVPARIDKIVKVSKIMKGSK